jgi:hypothetical protein
MIDPHAILAEIAANRLAPASARVNACKVLIAVQRTPPSGAQDALDLTNTRAIEMLSRDRRLH